MYRLRACIYHILIVLAGLISFSDILGAQPLDSPATPGTEAPLDQSAPPAEEDWLVHPITLELWKGLVAGIVPLAVASLVTYFIGLKSGIKQALSYFIAHTPKKGHRKNTILVLGLGRSGKSSLINLLTREFETVRPSRTTEFAIKECTKTFGNKPIDFTFTDYEGQDFASFVAGFIQSQLEPNTLLRYGDINSLILVTDLFRENKDEDHRKKKDTYETDRIDFHLREWNDTALDAVFGFLTKDELKFVCLFINKIDKWEFANQEEAVEKIKADYKPLIDQLDRRTKGYSHFEAIIGSADLGTNVIGPDGLLPKLGFYSVPLEGG